MNLYDCREKMILEYLKDVEGIEATNVYVTETKDADLVVDIKIDGSHTYTESIQMSFVMSWLWSKLK